MAYIDPKTIEEARKVDLLSYLKACDPGNLVHIGGNTYCTAEHDSLKISNGKWYWFSRGIGGYSALDYLVKVKEYSFMEAIEAVTGREIEKSPSVFLKEKPEKRQLILPELERHPYRAAAYLRSRGIHDDVIEYCIAHSMLFETTKYHNAVFVGYDKDGIARYGAMRSTTSNFKADLTGSDKHFCFTISENPESRELHVFESAIDLMSFATLEILEGMEWKDDRLLSLAGVFQTKRKDVVPVGLKRYLSENMQVKTIRLHLDNDEVGRGAAAGIIAGLGEKYIVLDEPPVWGKDINEMLIMQIENKRKREEVQER